MVVTSSIMERTNNEPLTLKLLRDNVPAVKAGQTAMAALKADASNPVLTRAEKTVLLKQKNAGTKAQNTLVMSALPLIKNVASKEMQRRTAWGSRISYEDILQEGIAGFIRGLLSFNVDAEIKSPTNYLGQWIMTSIRRQVESMDHDFNIPHETIERHRRMKAVYSRLAGELRRDPTDSELLDALNSEKYAADTSKWGRVSKSDAPRKTKTYTQKHLDEMRDISSKTYPLMSTSPTDADTETEFELSGTTLTSETTNLEEVDKQSLSTSQSEFFQEVFVQMRIGTTQKDVISRTFGLTPYVTPQTARDISMNTGLTQKYVKQLIQTFQQYMTLKGGIFHYLVDQINKQDVNSSHDLEFGWILPIVGEYPSNQRRPLPAPEMLTKHK